MRQYPSWRSITWIMIKSMINMIRAVPAISNMKQPRVTIFGGAATCALEDISCKQGYELARLLAQQGISVITGGGPSIMQAANCGVMSVSSEERNGATTLGIGVTGLDEGFSNTCAEVVYMPEFFARKWLLTHYADAFVIFPGGIGTCDEFFYVLNLRKHQLLVSTPIFLVGSAYWKPIIEWYQDAIKEGFIEQDWAHLFRIEDDIRVVRDMLCVHFAQPDQK